MSKQVWLITGTSAGIGKILTEALLAAGHIVVATARNPQNLPFSASKDQLLTLPLDVNDSRQIEAVVPEVLKTFGRIDVLVNNAGYGLEGAVEELTMTQIREQMETNFFGLVHLTQQVIPVMRHQSSGYIVNISSLAGLRGFKGFSIYNASKFAVEGFTEAIAQELEPFGIRVSVVEPGPYRTDWAGRSLQKSEALATMNPESPYFELNQTLKRWMESADGKQPGDPAQIARILMQAASHPKPPLHMLFGDEAIAGWNAKWQKINDDQTFFDTFPHQRTEL